MNGNNGSSNALPLNISIARSFVLSKNPSRTNPSVPIKNSREFLTFPRPPPYTSTTSKDGLRDGCVIYDETHQYESFDVVDVFGGGLGKVRNSREFFIGTDGFVRDGFLDKTKERAMEILSGKALDDPLFPFICKI